MTIVACTSRARSIALLFLLILTVVVVARPTSSFAGDAEGINGYKFKIYEDDNYVPPGDNGPASSAHETTIRARGPQMTASATTGRNEIPLLSVWSWLFQISRKL